MKLEEVTWQNSNDFKGILRCEHCDSTQFMDYGYQDDNFHNNVIPAIVCISCGKRGNKTIPNGISDPGTQGGFAVKKVKHEIEVWERA